MADNEGRRALVNDPLAANPREQAPDRSLSVSGVRAPMTPSNASLSRENVLSTALQGVEGILANEFEKKKDKWITEGKIAFQSGVTEQAMLAEGNRFTEQGYRTLQARDGVNNWFTKQSIDIDENSKRTDPAQYQAGLTQQRDEYLKNITDPAARKVASAAFEEMSPRLAASQAVKNNEFNRGERRTAFTSMLSSTASTSATASRQEPGKHLALSPMPVETVMQPSARDRDVGIRTILGEAANQGADGQAAVAHVLRNRAVDGRWPSSIAGVALQPKQFSAWNKGAGGNSLVTKYNPGDPVYDRAAEVFDSVMSGRHVDATGGATHYYSPTGMNALVAEGSQTNTVPAWLTEETAKRGGAVQIGGHVFAGKSNGAAGPREGAAAYDTKLSASEEAGFQTWKEKNAPNDSGADYDLRGAYKAGVKPAANGHWPDTYKKPNHPTFSNQSQYAVGEDAKRAGTWRGETFIPPSDLNAVPAQEGVAVTGIAANGGNNEVQQAFRGYAGLNNPDKATAAADAMRRGLEAGDDKLFRDLGGIAILQEFGAKPSEVDEVLKARARYELKKSNEFSVDNEQYRSDILGRAEKGEQLPALLADIDKRHKAGIMDDSNAKQLAHSAADKVRQENEKVGKKSKLDNPQMLAELGGLYQQIATSKDPAKDFVGIAEQGTAIAKKYGASEDDVRSVVGKMFSDSQGRQNKLRTDAEAATKLKIGQDATKSSVSRSLANGYGLGNVTGENIKIVNDHGQPASVTPVEYGVMQVKDKWGKLYKDKVTAGEMSQGQAAMQLSRSVALELQNHNVVDKETQAQIVGGLAGNILDDKAKGGLKSGASGAYNYWLALKTTPGIKPEYMAKVVDDSYTRGLLETAFLLDSGDLSKEQALLKAHEIMNDPNRDPNDAIAKDAVWNSKFEKGISETLMKRTDPGFFGRMFGTNDRNEQERILKNNKSAENYVRNRAEAYHKQNPNELGEVSLEKGLQDLQAHSVPVMGNLVITRPGKELDRTMNIHEFGPDAVNDAVSSYIRKNGKTLWGDAYTSQEEWRVTKAARVAGKVATFPHAIGTGVTDAVFGQSEPKGTSPHEPPVHITYNAEQGIMTVDLYKDQSKGQTLGSPKHFRVGAIGAEYRKEKTTPTSWEKTWNNMFKGTAQAVKDVREWSYDITADQTK